MSIATRITSMEQHIGNAYDKLDELGVDLTNVDKNLNNITDLLDEVYEDYPKTTTTNVTEPSIDNTKAGRMEIDLKGNTEQFTTTGKNFLNLNSMTGTTTSTGVTITPILKNNLLEYIKLTGTPSGTFWYQIGSVTLEPGDYIFSGIDVNNTGLKIALNTNALYIDKDNPTLTLNLTTRYTYTINIWCNNSSLYPTGEIKLKPMIRLSSIADATYEPYTGTTASPNPDYPQDVEVVSGENKVKVINKNFFDNTVERKNAYINDYTIGTTISYSNSSATYTFVKCCYLKAGNTYKLSWKQDSTPASTNARNSVIIDDDNKIVQAIYSTWDDNITEKTIIPTQSGWLVLSTDINVIDIQIEEGSTATTYTEHKEQDFPISLGNIELCKIGDYQDYIYKNNDNWYIKKNIRHLPLEIINMNNSADYPGWRNKQIRDDLGYGKNGQLSNYTNFMCNILGMNLTGVATNTGSVSDTLGSIWLSKSKFGLTQDQWKTTYPNLIFELYYNLLTSEDVPITGTTLISQLEAIYNTAKSYDNTTNIIQENNDLPFILDVITLSKEAI